MRLLVVLVACGLASVAQADITGTNPAPGSCLCLYYDSVNVRDGACGPVMGMANSGACFTYTGSKVTCDLSGVTYDYFELEYGSGTGWIAGDFMNVGGASSCSSTYPGQCSSVRIITRAEWGARPPAYTIPPLPSTPVSMAFVHHSVTSQCFDIPSCSAQMRSIQNYHMDSNGWPDIAYNYLVGDDGNAYEGRGWDYVGAHTFGYNDIAVAVCAIGDFTSVVPNQPAQDAIHNIFDCAVQQGILTNNYELFGHRDGGCTACPGDSFYPVLQTWPEYSTRDIPFYC